MPNGTYFFFSLYKSIGIEFAKFTRAIMRERLLAQLGERQSKICSRGFEPRIVTLLLLLHP